MDDVNEESKAALGFWAEEPEDARIPMLAFGRVFNQIPDHVRQDLECLEREGSIYSDQWVEELQDFMHVRISLTDEECKEFARRSWAYDLFLSAQPVKWASDVPGIDPDIAREADAYTLTMKDGTSIPAPYHCFAAFLGEHLEAVTCGMIDERRKVIKFEGREALLFDVRRAIESLTPTIRSFNNREKGLQPWSVACEDDVRDLLFVMLRPLVFDLVKEEPGPSRAGTYKVVDLFSKALKLFVEVKWIDKPRQWKRIVEEIHVDVQSYIAHPGCDTLIFAIVDAVRDIPDPRRLEHELSGSQTIAGRDVTVRVFVCEP